MPNMRLLAITIVSLLSVSLTGCYTQTNTIRTVRHQDGTLETYENHSNGYNYNPNYTGHMDNNYQIHSNMNAFASQTQNINAAFGTPIANSPQFTIR